MSTRLNKFSFSPMTVVAILCAAALLPSCMKTRAQLRGEPSADDSSADADRNENEASGTATTHRAGPAYELEEIRTELTRLSGRIDLLEHEREGANSRDTKEYLAHIDERVSKLEQLSAQKKRDEIPTQKLLGEGNELLKAKEFEESQDKFKQVLERTPPAAEAAEAHFGLGEAEFGMGNWRKAIVEYSKVQEVFPKTKLAPTCLSKIAQSFQKLNMTKEANGFWSELQERYPKSPEAKKESKKEAKKNPRTLRPTKNGTAVSNP